MLHHQNSQHLLAHLPDDDVEGSEDKPGRGDSEKEEEDMRKFLDDEAEQGPGVREEICGWPELREQIKEDLKMVLGDSWTLINKV